jgi:hypothetical protein
VLQSEVAVLIGYAWKIGPTTPMTSYVATMERMVKACRSAGATPVVLSPFIYGSRYTMRKCHSLYRDALRDLAKMQDMILVDCPDAPANSAKILTSAFISR